MNAAVKMIRSDAEYGNVDNDECRSKNGSSELESKGWMGRWEHMGVGLLEDGSGGKMKCWVRRHGTCRDGIFKGDTLIRKDGGRIGTYRDGG